MNIILGFGKTETDFENQEFDFVENFIEESSKKFIGDKGNKYDFSFSDKLVEELEKELKDRKEKYDTLSKEYKTSSEYPDRYSTYYFNILTDNYSNLCVIFKFSHISRNHPMSPDGWAMMGSKKVYYADILDFID